MGYWRSVDCDGWFWEASHEQCVLPIENGLWEKSLNFAWKKVERGGCRILYVHWFLSGMKWNSKWVLRQEGSFGKEYRIIVAEYLFMFGCCIWILFQLSKLKLFSCTIRTIRVLSIWKDTCLSLSYKLLLWWTFCHIIDSPENWLLRSLPFFKLTTKCVLLCDLKNLILLTYHILSECSKLYYPELLC